jgi:hypothetical protein
LRTRMTVTMRYDGDSSIFPRRVPKTQTKPNNMYDL